MNAILRNKIESWLRDYELSTDEPDPDTIDGSAYILLQEILEEAK